MSRLEKLWRQCTKKRPYETQEDAESEVLKVTQKPDYKPKYGEMLIAFQCSVCYKWHIGHSMSTEEIVARTITQQRRAGTLERNQRIYRLFCEGTPTAELARRYNMRPATIRAILRNAELIATHRKERNPSPLS